MQVERTQQDQSERLYAILRIKRKRNEEPLDGLVVDQELRPRRKRSRGTLNFFKFAETVEQGAWDDNQKKKDLETRLTILARQSAQGELPSSSVSAPAIVEQAAGITATPSPATPLRPPRDTFGRKYTIIRREAPLTEPPFSKRRRVPAAPPKVWSTKELEALKHAQVTMYDAIPSSSALPSEPSAAPNIDSEVAKFLPLLQDYLKLDDKAVVPPSPTKTVPPATIDESDYVYDVFYQRPTTFQELYQPSTSVSNIGRLTDVPDELMWYDSDTESEVGDTDDEDSNAEDWYKNDYPEELSDEGGSEGSDVFHENSDYEEIVVDRPIETPPSSHSE
ncbi:uncharacterized protein LAESUDRAFT_720131 [Laetiporus sulphureus 93-53]|uniref:Probable RNA polymerase II nuclear localization protein SLC7A6OS n=1 Tax=Laetiporus sulphureus 93-53 TaxID=1314785 RepID=A0A165HT65_9APHY|nr:uncharacterized protein LAESUDRAFT_720131 [Laetiporus sulphureus 93-53]KZT12156.1 hypothetical protein LAESUDRAFT_720131 [Laetiporus sulphureus 93-53]